MIFLKSREKIIKPIQKIIIDKAVKTTIEIDVNTGFNNKIIETIIQIIATIAKIHQFITQSFFKSNDIISNCKALNNKTNQTTRESVVDAISGFITKKIQIAKPRIQPTKYHHQDPITFLFCIEKKISNNQETMKEILKIVEITV